MFQGESSCIGPQIIADIRQVRSKLKVTLEAQVTTLSDHLLCDFEREVGALCRRLLNTECSEEWPVRANSRKAAPLVRKDKDTRICANVEENSFLLCTNGEAAGAVQSDGAKLAQRSVVLPKGHEHEPTAKERPTKRRGTAYVSNASAPPAEEDDSDEELATKTKSATFADGCGEEQEERPAGRSSKRKGTAVVKKIDLPVLIDSDSDQEQAQERPAERATKRKGTAFVNKNELLLPDDEDSDSDQEQKQEKPIKQRKNTAYVTKSELPPPDEGDSGEERPAERATKRKGTAFVKKEELLLPDDEDSDSDQEERPAERANVRKGTAFVNKNELPLPDDEDSDSDQEQKQERLVPTASHKGTPDVRKDETPNHTASIGGSPAATVKSWCQAASTTRSSWRSLPSVRLSLSSASDTVFEKRFSNAARRPSYESEPNEARTTRDRLRNFLKSWKYETISSLLILLNCITMGIQAHKRVAGGVGPIVSSACDVAEHVFTALFATECCVVYCVLGRASFTLRTDTGRSNLFDAGLVFFTGILIVWIIPLGYYLAGGDGESSKEMKMLMLLRVARLARLLRVFQRSPMLREAWLLVRGLFDSCRTLLWTCVVILVVTYVFAVVGLALVVPPLQEAWRASPDPSIENPCVRMSLEEVVTHVNGLDQMMFTLVQILLADSYHEFMRVVVSHVRWSWVYFYAYISVSTIVLLNLVTAIIVENARENSDNDHAHAINEKEAERKRTLRKLRRLFKAMDSDRSNNISWNEFQRSFEDQNMLELWTLLNFASDDCASVWRLIDDGDGVIEIDEFVDALTRMQGQAQAKDIFRLQRELTTMHKAVSRLSGVVSDVSLFMDASYPVSQQRSVLSQKGSVGKLDTIEEQQIPRPMPVLLDSLDAVEDDDDPTFPPPPNASPPVHPTPLGSKAPPSSGGAPGLNGAQPRGVSFDSHAVHVLLSD